jgi:hypothetical protein
MSAEALSADGRRAAGAGERGRIVTWSTATGEPLAAIEHGAAVAALGFSDGGELVTAGQRGDVRRRPLAPRWEVAAVLGGPAESTFTDRVTAPAFDAGGTRLAVGGGDPSRRGEVKIFALDGLTPVLDLPELHSDTVFALAFSADGRRLASAGGDKLVRVIDVASGAPVATFAGHTHHVLDVSWHYGGELLASAGADQVVKVWDLASGAQRRTLDGFDKQVSGVSFVAATTRIVTGSGDAKVRLLDAADGASVRSFEGFRDYVYALAQDLDGDLVVAGGFDGVLRVWATETGELRAAFAPP